MKDLLEAILIFAKYSDASYPLHCEHDLLTVMVEAEDVSHEHRERLGDLGFFVGDDGLFQSYRFGSA